MKKETAIFNVWAYVNENPVNIGTVTIKKAEAIENNQPGRKQGKIADITRNENTLSTECANSIFIAYPVHTNNKNNNDDSIVLPCSANSNNELPVGLQPNIAEKIKSVLSSWNGGRRRSRKYRNKRSRSKRNRRTTRRRK